MKEAIKKNYKFILGVIIGLVWSSGIVYAAVNGYLFDSDEVSYDNTSSGLTSENVQDALDELYANSDAYLAGLNAAHPIGSIFMTVNSNYDTAAKVGTALGGAWEAIGQGRVLIGAGTNGTYTFEAGSTGGSIVAGNSSSGTQTITNPLGEYTHQLNVDEMPSHSHTISNLNPSWYGKAVQGVNGTFNAPGTGTHNSGSNGSDYYHNNIQPYLVVYMYKRTA